MRISPWAGLLLLGNTVLSHAVHDKAPRALATITPCPAAPVSFAPPPITVTSQYQEVSTCEAKTACLKRRCTTQYSYHTYDYVSTIIPGPDSPITVTRTDQSVLISHSSTTITSTALVTKVRFGHRFTATATAYTTQVKEWSALYKDIGPLALPGYEGSGLCQSCKGPHGEKRQQLEVIECVSHPKGPTVCRGGVEDWIYIPAPTSTSKATAVCSSKAVAPSAGTFIFAFPQHAPPAVIHVPARTVTYTVGGPHPGVATTTLTETVTTLPGRDWTAFVTRSFVRPTTFDFTVTVTKTIFYTVPPWVAPWPT
ncbi:hypothetical protein A1O3_08163 [Capronia epimyces CBS 606.96]|uniref:Uncharacterized protein n=1 Tax=Capronia epimyces CBS 606.96 TaxID=1182542 RepID=W9XI60_9EURO|nr:uncharacterized protein A1O3_08163 [Capronia epimyces CBS 606.96]EXJ79878.1 hypothetical protein A1O3_08163 [Capronia epimyces CBS 606.96]